MVANFFTYEIRSLSLLIYFFFTYHISQKKSRNRLKVQICGVLPNKVMS